MFKCELPQDFGVNNESFSVVDEVLIPNSTVLALGGPRGRMGRKTFL